MPELDPAAAWSFAAAVSPRPKVRVADLDDSGRPLNCYSRELRLTSPIPDRPYALYLTDAAGDYRLLGFDLDPGHGPVTEDLAALQDLLDRAGLSRHVVCASGPGGGRHVWIALTRPAPADLVGAAAHALAARLPSLDTTPLANPATGCLRPPGAPHRTSGRSQLLSGTTEDLLHPPAAGPDQLHALLALLDAPPARRPALDTAAGLAGVTTDTTGALHLRGTRTDLPAGSRAALTNPLTADADASAVLWSVLLGAVRARWRLDELTGLLDTAPGLEHARTGRQGATRTPRGQRLARRVLAHQWNRAVYHVAGSPAIAGDDPTFTARVTAAVAAVTAVQGRAQTCPGRWARAGGPADRRVLDAVCDQLLAAVQPAVELDVRRLGELCGISRETARRALHRLADDQWLRLVQPAAGVHASHWSLHAPVPATSTPQPTTGVSQADSRPPDPALARAAWRTTLAHRLADSAHDVFTPRPGLGHHAGRVYAHLTSRPQPRHQLVNALGYPSSRLDQLLERLHDAGLARLGPGMVWRRHDADRGHLARDFDTSGILADRQRRHTLERQAWAWWLDELAWMRLPRDMKRRQRPPAAGQTVIDIAALTPRQRRGAHPRRPDGQADFAGAAALLRRETGTCAEAAA